MADERLDLSLYTQHKRIHSSFVSEVSLLTNPLDGTEICIKTIARNPPKPHSPMRELHILKTITNEDPHNNIITLVSSWKHMDGWTLVFPYYTTNLKHVMLNFWEWCTPKPKPKRKYLNRLLFVEPEHPPSQEQGVLITKDHFLVNKMPPKLVEHVWNDITSALKHLDKHKIMHRDIKPENILLDSKRRRFVLIDFGISTGFGTDEVLQPDGVCDVGTSIYKPLEALLGISDYDNRLDMWSFMVIMHQMCIPFICAYSLQPSVYDITSDETMSVDDKINMVCAKVNTPDKIIHLKHELKTSLDVVPSLIDDGSYLIDNIMCEGSDISLLSSIHNIFGCPLQSQFPMGVAKMAWVYMYNNNDKPERKYFEDDPVKQSFMKDFVFGLAPRHMLDNLVKMCHYDYSKRLNINEV